MWEHWRLTGAACDFDPGTGTYSVTAVSGGSRHYSQWDVIALPSTVNNHIKYYLIWYWK